MKVNNLEPAFTIAEILITLAIIGIVAALTIPSLIEKTEDAENKAAWKKAFSDISQVTMKLINDNGGTFKGITDNGPWLVYSYKLHMKMTKVCQGSWACMAPGMKARNGGALTYGPSSNWSTSVLENGMLMGFRSYDGANCASAQGGGTCGELAVDVNGIKGPNRIGKDIFVVFTTAKGLRPFASVGANACADNANGYGCSSQYLIE